MKILGFEITRPQTDADNVTKKARERVKVLTKTIQREWTRTKQDVGKWRAQTIIAESKQNPQRTELYNIYRDVVLDAHLSSLMRTLFLSVSAGKFWVTDPDGTENEDDTAKFSAPWFIDYLRHYVDSKFWGHSLIQIAGIENDRFIFDELVPREHVVPEFGIVKANPWNYATDGTPFREFPFNDWVIEIGEKCDLGLLHKATPLVLWKKGVFGSWSQFAELFGMPLRIGKTDILNPDNKKNMENMLANMAGATWGVFNNDDSIEFIENTKTDTYKVYDSLIERANSELSKLILGQTGTTDEKSFVGSANVHSDILGTYVLALKNEIARHIETVVLPLMARHNMIKPGQVFKWDNSENLSVEQQFNIVKELLVHYKIPEDYISKTFNVPVEEKQIPGLDKDAIKDIDNLYKGL